MAARQVLVPGVLVDLPEDPCCFRCRDCGCRLGPLAGCAGACVDSIYACWCCCLGCGNPQKCLKCYPTLFGVYGYPLGPSLPLCPGCVTDGWVALPDRPCACCAASCCAGGLWSRGCPGFKCVEWNCPDCERTGEYDAVKADSPQPGYDVSSHYVVTVANTVEA